MRVPILHEKQNSKYIWRLKFQFDLLTIVAVEWDILDLETMTTRLGLNLTVKCENIVFILEMSGVLKVAHSRDRGIYFYLLTFRSWWVCSLLVSFFCVFICIFNRRKNPCPRSGEVSQWNRTCWRGGGNYRRGKSSKIKPIRR